MAQKKQLLHELLQEDQEPFHLNTYISDRRSQFIPPATTTTTLQVINKRRQPVAAVASTSRSNLCRHACFFSFHQNSPDVRKSPFFDFPSPAKSPCKSSPGGGVFLHIPSRTAAVLVEAAMRIQKQQQSKAAASRATKSVGLGLFGSFLKRLKDRSKSKKRALQNSGANFPAEKEVDENVRMSCSCSNRRPSSADWTENNEEADCEASTSSCGSDYCSSEIIINSDFDLGETRFCLSPFRFSLHQSPSSSGRRTPDFCSPAASPSRRVNHQENENYEARNLDKEDEEEEKKQCSPVSVLEPPFKDDLRETEDAEEEEEEEEDDYDLDCGYENVERAKQQLLHRLCRFEKLAELDPIELERKLLEASDEETEGYYSEDDVAALSLYKKQSVETFVRSKNMSTDMKRLVSDLIVEEKSEIIWSVNSNEVVMGRISNKLDSWKEVEFDTIDMMIGLDFKKEFDLWTNFREQVEETSAEIELAVFRGLIEELSDEIFDLRTQYNY